MSRYLRAELILPVTILFAAIMLGVSEFMTTFVFSSGGEPQIASTAADRHSFALLILAVFAVGGALYAILSGLRPAAIAAAVFGLAALLLFLLLDLPDAGRAGPLGDDPVIYFADARADPQTGFWLEAVGSVVLALATVAFATLRSHQLRAPVELFSSGRPESGPTQSDPASAGDRGSEGRRGESFDAEAAERRPDRPRRALPSSLRRPRENDR